MEFSTDGKPGKADLFSGTIVRYVLLLCFCVSGLNASACLNAEGVDIFGHKTLYDTPFKFIEDLREPFPKETLHKRIQWLESEIKTSRYPYGEVMELSVYLVYDGQYDQAIRVLHKQGQDDEYTYSICANLGVAHELLGNLDSAYFWTKRAVEINASSHYGSEWIHLKILEAQQALQNDPHWLENHTVLDIPISRDSLPDPASFDKIPVQVLADQLEYQLLERMYFVQPENAIVGQLLLLLADAYSLAVDAGNAAGTYALAKVYDPGLATVVDKRLAVLERVLHPGLIEQIAAHLPSEWNETDTDAAQEEETAVAEPAPATTIPSDYQPYIWLLLGGILGIVLIAALLRNQRRK